MTPLMQRGEPVRVQGVQPLQATPTVEPKDWDRYRYRCRYRCYRGRRTTAQQDAPPNEKLTRSATIGWRMDLAFIQACPNLFVWKRDLT